MNVLITRSSGKGGVASFYQSILPFLAKSAVYYIRQLEVGSAFNDGKLIHPFIDQIRVYKRISKGVIDLMHVNPSLDLKSVLRDGMIMLLAHLKKIPVVVFIHGWDDNFERTIDKKMWWFFRRTFLKCNGFIVLSSGFKKKLLNWGVKAPIFLCTTTVDENLISGFSIENKLASIRNSPVLKILFLSRLEKKKGVIETIEAFNILISRGYRISLSIAGDGPMMKEIRSFSRQKEPWGEINFLGDVRGSKKVELLSSHHIYCFPTYYGEGLPTTILEAMAFGLPVVTRPVGGTVDFFENEKMGYITESKSPVVLAGLIEQLLLDRIKMVDIAKYNHDYALTNFRASFVAEHIIKIYNEIIFAR